MATGGTSAVKARAVAAESGMSTMVVYNYFGGVPELVNAITDRGFAELEASFCLLPVTDDPVSDLFRLALATRDYAGSNPYLYDAMFGLSTRASYRTAVDGATRRVGQSEAFLEAYRHVIDACGRLVTSTPVTATDPTVVAGALWSLVHGFVSLELGEHFANFDDPVRDVLVPTAVAFCVGLGEDEGSALRSHFSVLEDRRGRS